MKKLLFLVPLILVLGCVQETNQLAELDNDVVFMSRADSPFGELYYYNNSNNEIIRLTNNDRHENNPAISKNGRYVAFHAGDESNALTWEIYYIDLETMEETQVTSNNLLDGHPDWSPNNEMIVYASFQDSSGNPAGTADLFIINNNGTGLTRLTDNEHEDNDPEWSPDGTKIAFKSTRLKNETFQEELYVMNADGSNITRLTTTTGWVSDHDPSWSMNSDYLVFTRYEGSIPWVNIADFDNFETNYPLMTPWNAYKVDLNGNIEQLTHSQDISALPVYSPQNIKIMYIDYETIRLNNIILGFQHWLTIIDTDATNPTIIFKDEKYTPTLEYFDW